MDFPLASAAAPLLQVINSIGSTNAELARRERLAAQPHGTALLTLDFIEAVYTRTQMLNRDVHTELGRRALLSFHAGRSGDVFYQTKPFWIDFAYGTNHGSPYNYDTHVPLLWFGAGIPAGVRSERVGVDDLAPTLSRLLLLASPPQSEGRALF